MIFISIRKKTFGIFLTVVVLCILAITVYAAVKVSQSVNKYNSVLEITRMFDDTHFIAYITDRNENNNSKNIEVFDITKGGVIARKPSTMEMQNEVINYVKSIKSLCTKIMPFPEKGYVIRVPIDPPVKVKQKQLNDAGIKTLDCVFIILNDKEDPILLVLDKQERPYFYTFDASIQPLLDYMKLSPESGTMNEIGNTT
ncbi:MAG TPA: hypothetical protein GX501_05810 [Clostridiaceae bacterium]|nr:hypothetical protein [Clostridiaceae bacterium]